MGLDEPIELSKDRKVTLPMALIAGLLVLVVMATRWLDSKLMVIDSVPSLALTLEHFSKQVAKLEATVDRLATNTELLTEALKHAESSPARVPPQLSNRRPSTVQAGGRGQDVRPP